MKKPTIRSQLKAGAKVGALALALTTLPVGAQAAGLGKLTVLSVIGQPLRAEIDITASREEIATLRARLASFESFRKAGIDYASILNSVRVSIDQRPDGRPYLQLRSDKAIYDPFLDILLEVNWSSGMLVREYTFLLDPPDALNKAPSQAEPITPATLTVAAPPTKPVSEAHLEPAKPAEKAPAKSAKPASPIKTETIPAHKQEGSAKDAVPDTSEKSAAIHQVKPGETLGRIANTLRPEGVDLDQMLMALYKNNKSAFEGGNINRLKAGKILAIPDAESVAAIDAREARQFITAQSADFSAYRRKLAAAAANAAAPQEEAPRQSTRGKIEPRVEEKTPAVAGKDKLEISRSATTRSDEGKSPKAQAAAKEEDRLARDKALKDANSRIAELDKNLADMKKLLEIKNQMLAEAQKQAQNTKTAPPASSAPATKPVEAKPTESKPAAPVAAPAPTASTQVATATTPPIQATPPKAEAPSAEKPVEPTEKTPPTNAATDTTTDAPKADEKPDTPPPEKQTPPKPARKKLPPPQPQPQEEPSFIEDNPEIVMAGGGILALLLGYLGFNQWKRKRKPKEEKSIDVAGPSSQSEPSINSVFGNAAGQTVDTGSNLGNSSLDADFSVASVGDADANEGVDPIAEADVYMAYGRNAQAEEILLDALKSEPSRLAIHLKLLDIYAARKSLKQFESIALDLRDQTGGNGEEWDQALILGKQIDPDNPLYSDGAPTPMAEDEYDPAATMVMSTDEMEQLARDLAAPGGAGQAAATEVEAIEEPAQEETAESLDFELDLGGDSVLDPNGFVDTEEASASSETATELANPVSSATDDISAMDFDLGTDEPAIALEIPANTPGTSGAQAGQASIPDNNGMDFDLDFPKSATDSPDEGLTFDSTPPKAAAELEASLNQSLDQPLDHALETSLDTPLSPPAARSVDLSAISLDLEPPSTTPVRGNTEAALSLEIPPLSTAAEGLAAPRSPVEAPMSEAALADDTPGSPEVDTKLELAAAYEEMGDTEGARELLQEVLNEGNAAQKAAAQSKLAQLT